MQIAGSVALVTGANRGLGRAFARELVERGAAKTYAAARDPSAVTDPGVIPVALDITDPESVSAAAVACTDVTLLINNAGILVEGLAASASLADARVHLEVNYLGTLAMSQAFAPILSGNGGGALVNVLSVLSLVTNPRSSTYAASKAAGWSITNALRVELRSQGTQVVGVFCAYIDTEMAATVDAPKVAPEQVAARTLEGIIAGEEEVFVDPTSRYVKDNLGHDLDLIYPGIQEQHDAAVGSAKPGRAIS